MDGVRNNAGILADDVALWCTSPSPQNNVNLLKTDLEHILGYCERNGFLPNVEKFELIHFTKKNTDSAQKTSLTIDNMEIKPKQEIKYLGIIWDSALTWKPHIRYIEKKMAYPLYRLSRIAKHIPTKCALAIYKTTIRPIMEYGCPIWWSHLHQNHTAINSLTQIQRKALQLSTGTLGSTASLAALEVDTITMPLHLRWDELTLRWAHKIPRLPSTHPLRTYMTIPTALTTKFARKTRSLNSNLKLPKPSVNAQPLESRFVQPDCLHCLFPRHMFRTDCPFSKRRDGNTAPAKAWVQSLHESIRQKATRGTTIAWSDGSVSACGTRCGSGALVYTITPLETRIIARTYSTVNVPTGNSNMAEWHGLLSALHLASRPTLATDRNLHIFVDCKQLIDFLFDHSMAPNLLAHEVRQCLSDLLTRNCTIVFHWIPSHIGIKQNELVDHQAKQASARRRPAEEPPIAIPFQHITSVISRAIYSKWGEQWRSPYTPNTFYKRLSPTIKERPHLFVGPRSVVALRCLVRLNAIHFPDNNRCVYCGAENDATHYLLLCPEFDSQREQLLHLQRPVVDYTPLLRNILLGRNLSPLDLYLRHCRY